MRDRNGILEAFAPDVLDWTPVPNRDNCTAIVARVLA